MAITDLDITDNDDALYYNLSIHTADLGMTNDCKRGLCAIEDGDLLRVMLHLFGMDVTRSWYFEPLLDGCGYISQYTGEPIIGGDLIVGYQRTDDNWKRFGLKNLEKYLFTDQGVDILLQQIEDSKMVRNMRMEDKAKKRGRGRPKGSVKQKV